jgi:hypothetical protein
MSSFVAIQNFGGQLLMFSAALTAVAQCTPADREQTARRANAEVSRIGTAEVSSAPTWVIDSYAYRCQQPDVYWHDKDWNIGLLLPSAENDPYALRIRSRSSQEKIVRLEDSFNQIASISLTPNDDAIVVAYVYGKLMGEFSVASIVDLKAGKVVDEVVASSISTSPNRRFLIYLNGDQTYPVYDYRLYDLLRTPRENTCGYRQNDPEHKDFDEEYRGVPIYPKKAHQVSCSDLDQKPFEDENHQRISNFLWSADSSKVIFVDAKDEGTLNLILVTMPTGPKDLPNTSISRPNATPIHWSNSSRGNKEPIQLSWESESDQTVSIRSGSANALTIHLSNFVGIE